MNEVTVGRTFDRFLSNIDHYRQRSRKIRSMINEYQQLIDVDDGAQHYWLQWALRHSSNHHYRHIISQRQCEYFTDIVDIGMIIGMVIIVMITIISIDDDDYRFILKLIWNAKL
jgi:hypothetical protein